MENCLRARPMAWQQHRLWQAGRNAARRIPIASIQAARACQTSAKSAEEKLTDLTRTMRMMLEFEREGQCSNVVRHSTSFSEMMSLTLTHLRDVIPEQLKPEVVTLQTAFTEYPQSNENGRAAKLDRIQSLLLRMRMQAPMPNGTGSQLHSSMARNPSSPDQSSLPASLPPSQQPSNSNGSAYQPVRSPNGQNGSRLRPQNGQLGFYALQPQQSLQQQNQSRKQLDIHRRRQPDSPSLTRVTYPRSFGNPQSSPSDLRHLESTQTIPFQGKPARNAQSQAQIPVSHPQHPEPNLPIEFYEPVSPPVSAFLESSEAQLLVERRESSKHVSTSGESHLESIDYGLPGLTGRTDYKLYSRDPGNAYARLSLGIHPGCFSNKYRVIAFDTETAGVMEDNKFVKQMLVEIAAIDLQSGQSMQTLINPDTEISEQICRDVHHISQSMVSHPDVPTLREACMAFLDFVYSQVKDTPGVVPVLCAHNGKAFDIPVLKYNFQMCGLEFPENWMYLDTVLLAREWRPDKEPNNSLKSLREQYNLPIEGALHHAMTDTKLLAQLVYPLMSRINISHLDELMVRPGRKGSVGWLGDQMDEDFKRSGRSVKKTGRKAKILQGEGFEAPQQPGSLPSLPISFAEEIREVVRSFPISPEGLMLPNDGNPESGSNVADWVNILGQPYLEREFLDEDLSAFKDLTDKQRKNILTIKDQEQWTPLDVLQQYPRDYQDCFVRMEDNQYATIVGTITKHKSFHAGKFQIVNLEVEVDPAELAQLDPDYESMCGSELQTVNYKKVTQDFFAGRGSKSSTAPRAAQESQILMQGKLKSLAPGLWEMDSNANLFYDWHPDKALPPLIVPVYAKRQSMEPRDWKNVMPKMLRAATMSKRDTEFWETLPEAILEKYQLEPWLESMLEMHQPTSTEALQSAVTRLAFQELLFLQLFFKVKSLLIRQSRGGKRKPVNKSQLLTLAQKNLPYKLTNSQSEVLKEILEDMAQPLPMLRLLQGDVGCGKTIVAFLALLATVSSGFQGVIMAPTETVVDQHFQRLTELVSRLPEDKRPKVVKFSGPACRPGKARREILEGLADGSIDLIVGTTALVSNDAVYKKLGLAVIDEQHKFGVEQRAKLQAKADPMPHVLSMTATPIPRTMALVSQGDMAISTIDELPPNRQRVETVVVEDSPDSTAQMYEEVRAEIEAGGRVYIVSSFIDTSKNETLEDVRATTKEFEELAAQETLGKNVKLGLLHGRLKSEEKLAVMQAFASGKVQALVSTTLVEVGLDVAEASVMIINNAERFGLAQLHQLRGRVGRGKRKSKCYLINADKDKEGRTSHNRLQLMSTEHNGLKLAEADLATRGQGDVLGKQQSGKDIFATLKVAKLPEHAVLLEEARDLADHIVSTLGMNPSNWPTELLIAMSRQNLPKLDTANLPNA